MKVFALAALLLICPAVAPAAPQTILEAAGETQKLKPERRTRVRLAGIGISAGYAHFNNPFHWGYRPMFWDPFWNPFWGPYWGMSPMMMWPAFHPGYFTGFASGPGLGRVRLQTGEGDREADVLIDGAYAGLAKDRRSMWLEPGAYTLEVRSNGEVFRKRIYVLSGKTLNLEARLQTEGELKGGADQ